jgi:tight adherence protein C
VFGLGPAPLPSPSLGLVAVISAVGLGCGLWALLIPSERRSRSGVPATSLERIAHGLRDVSQEARLVLNPTHTDPASIALEVLSPTFVNLSAWFHRVTGGQDGELVDQAGWAGRHDAYQFARLLSALSGLLATTGFALVFSLSGDQFSPSVMIVVAGSGALLAVGLFDRWVRRRARLTRERLSEEFPTIVELLALALSAGDSLFGALRRISQRGNGELASQWSAVVRRVELGEPLGPALTQSAKAMGVEEIEALVDHLVHALDRGAPVAEVVRAHSSDSRLRRLRSVVDKAGKAEVVMLVPLVMLILPITVIFAVWPSLQALQWGVGFA